MIGRSIGRTCNITRVEAHIVGRPRICRRGCPDHRAQLSAELLERAADDVFAGWLPRRVAVGKHMRDERPISPSITPLNRTVVDALPAAPGGNRGHTALEHVVETRCRQGKRRPEELLRCMGAAFRNASRAESSVCDHVTRHRASDRCFEIRPDERRRAGRWPA